MSKAFGWFYSALTRTLEARATRAAFARRGAETMSATPAAFTAGLRADRLGWRKVHDPLKHKLG